MLRSIIKKELKRVFSDRRLIFSVFVLPPIMIFVIYSFMGTMIEGMINNIEEHQGRVYILQAPEELVTYTEDLNLDMEIVYVTPQEDLEGIKENIRLGNVDLLVAFEDGFMDNVMNYSQVTIRPEVKTYYNPSEEYSLKARNDYINNVLMGFENRILADRFGNINHIRAFDIDRANDEALIQDDKKATGKGLGMIMPMLITIFLFAGAMSIGLDTIAGEKERGTMATLLLSPLRRETIALGKVISLGIVSILSALITFVAMVASLPFAGKVYTGGADVSISSLQYGILEYAQLLTIMIVMVAIFVGLICLVSVRAKTVKEATAYATPLYFVVMIASFSNMFSTATPDTSKFAIPVYNSVLSIKALLEFDLTMQQFLITIGTSIALFLVLLAMITRTFNDEKIMLNA